MKPWAERSAGERAGVVAGVAAAVAAILFGIWKVGPASAPPATETAATEGQAEPAPEAAPAPAGTATETDAAQGADGAPAADAAAEATAPAQDSAAAPTAEPEAAPADTATAEDGAAAADTATALPEASTDAPDAAQPEAASSGTADASSQAPAESAVAEPAPTEPAVPEFDLVRVTPDGSAVLAGSGAPGATMILRLDGAEIGTVPADGQGNFVALFNLAPSEAPRILTLAMRLADGTEVAAPGRVVISPTVAPEAPASAPVVAEAEGAGESPAPEATAEAPEPAPQAPAALLVTDEGARVLQSAQDISPAMAANVTVDAITYTPEGDVQFAGRGTGGSMVRLYLDNAQIADAVIDRSGAWALTMPGIEPGIYTLRADQIGADGKVTSRFETPFKRETMEALAAAAAAEADAAAQAATQSAEQPADTAEAGAPADARPVSVTVQPGFSLWKIARENLGDGILYVQVFEANKDQIRDPDLIYPGQVFAIPSGD